MATVTTQPMTAEEFALLDQDVPVELVRGEVVEMCRPKAIHALICKNVAVELDLWVTQNGGLGFVLADPGVITERNPDSVRGPDVCYISKERADRSGGLEGFLGTGPELAVEVKSPSESWKSLQAKINEYFLAGVQEVWVLERDERLLTIYRIDLRPTVLNFGDRVTSPLFPGFEVEVARFFRDVPVESA